MIYLRIRSAVRFLLWNIIFVYNMIFINTRRIMPSVACEVVLQQRRGTENPFLVFRIPIVFNPPMGSYKYRFRELLGIMPSMI